MRQPAANPLPGQKATTTGPSTGSAGQRFPALGAWAARGRRERLCGLELFTLDVPPADERAEPLLVIHGFPTCSWDWRHLVDALAADRRVLLLDLPGHGLSDKPDRRYSVELHADAVQSFVERCGLRRLALLTHDMGDSVGGELLARQLEGSWPIEVTRRVITNGSIYIDMAELSAGQRFLLSLPDRALEDAPDEQEVAANLAGTMAPGSTVARNDLASDAALVCHGGGAALLPRTIRYVEDRRRHEARYTGAIEHHPAPLAVIWGTEDPIAVEPMVDRLAAARPDVDLHRLSGIGHYPMLEAPEAMVPILSEAFG